MIKRLQKTSAISYFSYFSGGDPTDVWEFDANGAKYKLINGWRSGAKLFKNDELLLENKEKYVTNSNKPFMEINDEKTKITIYIKAAVSVKVKVAVNDQFLQNDFV